ncbi:EAL domain-containing protein [Paraburkholderia strydomiana]|uniref:sensor domain-containing protein n=1 Tax=Paraburkholderia strydomiana TaxID=1245417 RepID=UPI0038B77357
MDTPFLTNTTGTYAELFVESMPDMVWVKDVDGTFLVCNAVVERLFGVSREVIIGKTDYDFVDSALADTFRANDLAALNSNSPHTNQEWLTFADNGERRLVETKKTPLRDKNGNVLGVLGVARDITEYYTAVRNQEALSRSLKLIGRCNHAMTHAVDEQTLLFDICQLVVDVGGYQIACVGFGDANDEKSVSIVAWSHASSEFAKEIRASWGDGEFAGGTVGSAIREGATAVNNDFRTNQAMQPWRALAEEHGLRSSIAIPLVANGAVFGALIICSASPDAFAAEEETLLEDMAADLAFGVQTLRARRERDSAKQQLEFLAHHDSLTGTPNRVKLREHFRGIAHQSQGTGVSVAVLLLDLDNFKFVNDSLGHDCGDRLLIEVTRKLERHVRGAGTVYRYGGDEFVVLLYPVSSREVLARYMHNLLASFAMPLTVDDYAIDSTLSVGVSLFPAHSSHLDELLRFADTALQKAKQSGKNTFHLFSDALRSDELELVRLRSELRAAIRNAELLLFYQPKVELTNGRIVGAEALLRWRHPQRGLLTPGTFIPLAERTGIIVELGDWAIDEACRQLAAWLSEGFSPIRIAVNVSALQVRRGNLLLSVTTALRRWRAPAENLELEFTESVLLDDVDNVIALISSLRLLGVKVSIDDFGTGYSSLAYLKNLPFDGLKVDQTFVSDMTEDPSSLAIVKTIVQLGRNLNMMVTAEGVEAPEQLKTLRDLGCTEIQGYLVSRPLSAEDFERFLRKAESVFPVKLEQPLTGDGLSLR